MDGTQFNLLNNNILIYINFQFYFYIIFILNFEMVIKSRRHKQYFRHFGFMEINSIAVSIDKTIIEKFKEGDTIAFDSIYHTYSGKLHNFAFGLLKNSDDSRELIQEVFVNLWEKRSQVDTALNFENYIFTITYNSIRKFFRKKAMENRIKDYLFKHSPEAVENNDASVIYDELLELVKKTVEKLPPKRKAVYKLSRYEGMGVKEIASKLNISKRTAENHLARALKNLKKELSGISMLALLFYHLFLG